MKTLRIFFAVFFVFLSTSPLHAKGTYFIDKDENGFYIQTERDGTWYIEKDANRKIHVGEGGNYHIKSDEVSSFIVTDNHGSFQIDEQANERLEQEIMGYNQGYKRESGSGECKVVIKGNQVLVPVVLGYGEKEIEVLLLLDTGASITALHRDLVDVLNIREAMKAKFRAVGGQVITTNLAKLSYIKVGPFKKENIYAGIIEYEGPSAIYKGLLGMNFLRNLEFRIDFGKETIEWKP
jgi:predicted aspartyl protease